MHNQLITIVITTYQRPDRIARAVSSALAQRCNKEIIVVDDNGAGSQMQVSTAEALNPYIDQITYIINRQNGGPGFSRNQAIQIAKGEYITFMDDDDEIHPDKLRLQAELLEQKGKDYSCCYCSYTKILEGNRFQTNGESAEGDVFCYMLARSLYVGSGTNLLIRTSVIQEVGPYNETIRRFEDYEFMVRLLEHYKMAYLDQDLMTIHNEIRDNPNLHKVSYEKLVADDDRYFSLVKGRIDTCTESEQKKIYQTAALERWRYSLVRRQTKDAFENLRKNQVSFFALLRYIMYLVDRVIRKKSYGFKL